MDFFPQFLMLYTHMRWAEEIKINTVDGMKARKLIQSAQWGEK